MKPEKLLLPVAWAILLFAASLLRFKTILSGDSLFFENLANDLFRYGGKWVDWKFTAAPSFLPDMALYMAAYPVFSSAFDRIFAVSFAQAVLIAGVAHWFARQIHPQLSRRAGAAIVLGVALVTLAAVRSSMWLFYYSTNNHLAALLFGLAGLVAALHYGERPERRRAWVLPLIVGVATVSTRLFTLNFTAPALVLLGTLWLRAPRGGADFPRRRFAALLGQMIAGIVLAQLLEKLLIHHNPSEGNVHASPATAGRALTFLMRATATAFTPDNPWTFAVALLLLGALLFAFWRLVRAIAFDGTGVRIGFGPDLRIAATGALLAVTVPVTLLGTVLSGRFGDDYAYRYLVFPLALAALFAIVVLDRAAQGAGRARAGTGAGTWAWYAVLACAAVSILKGSLHTLHHTAPVVRHHAISDCLADLERKGVALHAGISEFWMGPTVSAYTPTAIPIVNTLGDLTPLHWVSTIGPLLRPQNYPAYRFHFALLRASNDPEGHGYTPDTIGKLLPPPDHVYICPNDSPVWVYDGMALDTTVRAAAARYFDKKGLRP